MFLEAHEIMIAFATGDTNKDIDKDYLSDASTVRGPIRYEGEAWKQIDSGAEVFHLDRVVIMDLRTLETRDVTENIKSSVCGDYIETNGEFQDSAPAFFYDQSPSDYGYGDTERPVALWSQHRSAGVGRYS